VLLPHTMGFFTKNSLPFSYDPTATCPQWLQFLSDAWGDDQESIDLLQEFFAYVLAGDSRQQKFLNIIGPRRSGKGTINKVLVSLLGEHNTVAPQLSELCETFGLQPWISKLLASFTDARLTSRDSVGIVSQLLRIVGNDTITVNRKNKEAWSGYLPTRIVVYSNEALQLQENSNALSGRMLVLQMTNSFYGKEDIHLADKLVTELSGIFNWALEGHRRRLERPGEKFIQPRSGQATLDMIAELNNPLSEFMTDCIVFERGEHVDKDAVFACYRRWVVKKNLQAGSELSFKRRFIAATQEYGVSTALDRTGGQTRHIYTNMRLTDKAQAFIDSMSEFEAKEIF
jgi:P4 family phage/plasmid primase-like protien